MRSRINSTGRRRITRDRIAIHARDSTAFDVTLTLDGLALPPDGRVVVEAHRQSVTERFDFGAVTDIRPASPPILRQFAVEDATFRIKVINPDGGRLLARADRLRADAGEGGGRRELLTVKIRDIGPEPWRTEFMPGGEPCLVLNDSIPGAAARITSDRVFQALVIPAAFRQVLHLLWTRHEQIDADEDTPASRWLTFASALTGMETMETPDWDDSEAVLDWIDAACTAFAGRHNFIIALMEAGHDDGKTAY